MVILEDTRYPCSGPALLNSMSVLGNDNFRHICTFKAQPWVKSRGIYLCNNLLHIPVIISPEKCKLYFFSSRITHSVPSEKHDSLCCARGRLSYLEIFRQLCAGKRSKRGGFNHPSDLEVLYSFSYMTRLSSRVK
jgi:hypothetical protein